MAVVTFVAPSSVGIAVRERAHELVVEVVGALARTCGGTRCS